jgi:hypothetical protein
MHTHTQNCVNSNVSTDSNTLVTLWLVCRRPLRNFSRFPRLQVRGQEELITFHLSAAVVWQVAVTSNSKHPSSLTDCMKMWEVAMQTVERQVTPHCSFTIGSFFVEIYAICKDVALKWKCGSGLARSSRLKERLMNYMRPFLFLTMALHFNVQNCAINWSRNAHA